MEYMYPEELWMLIVCAVLVIGALVHGCFRLRNQGQVESSSELTPNNAAGPPSVDAVAMMSMGVLMLDYVTYTYCRQNDAAAAAADDDDDDTSASPTTDRPHGSVAGSTTTTAATTTSEECAICQGQFQDGNLCSVMPLCRHEFHKHCIANWLMAYKNTCPLCRAQLNWFAVANNIV